MHGGKTPQGIASPHFKGKGYSKALPKHLQESYDRAYSDPDLMSLKKTVALLDVRMEELVRRLNSGDTAVLWLDVQTAFASFRAAMVSGDALALSRTLGELDQLISRGVSYEQAWGAVVETAKEQADISAREWKRQIDLQNVITTDRAMTLIITLLETVKRHVHDRVALQAISEEATLLLRGGRKQIGHSE